MRFTSFWRQALLCLWLGTLGGCGEPEAERVEEARSRPAVIVEVTTSAAARSQSFPGVVRAAQRAELSFDVGGQLAEFPAVEGAKIAQGALIARLDAGRYEAQVRSAEAEFKRAELDYRRHLQLWERSQAVARSAVDDRLAAMEVMRGRLHTARRELADTRLVAPFAGVLVRRRVEDHANVQAKQPIAELQTLDRLEVVIHVPERAVRESRRGDLAHAFFEGHPDRPVPVRLRSYSAEARPQTQSYEVVLGIEQLEEVGFIILPGMSALVRPVAEAAAQRQLSVPIAAVTADATGSPQVWVVDQTGQVQRRAVVVGEIHEGNVEVLEGLVAGERVVAVGVSALSEGMRVHPLEGAGE